MLAGRVLVTLVNGNNLRVMTQSGKQLENKRLARS